jgi:hypothetical protein
MRERHPRKPQPIHFIDRTWHDMRPICGAWHDGVNWTTVRRVVTCPACARLLRAQQREAIDQEPAPIASPAEPG